MKKCLETAHLIRKMNVFHDTRMGVLQKQGALVNSAMGNVGREFHVA